jgi:PhnB protein
MNWFDNVEDRPHPWQGLNWITAMLYVPNVKEAVEFYEKSFGFVPILEFPDQSDPKNLFFARIRYRGTNFTVNPEGFNYEGLSPKSSGVPPAMIFYLYVDDASMFFETAVKGGCRVIDKPRDEFWGDKRCRVSDPFGYVWDIAEKIK